MQTTFHRAFDMACDLEEALEAAVAAGCRRILTSGGRNTAVEGIDTL
ncbi:copper homeostasis protein CutC, partial [Alistipes sp.]